MAKETQGPKTVTIPIDKARCLLDLYNNIEAADAHFQRCQSDLFRQHMAAVYKAPLVASAFEALRAVVAELDNMP